MSCVSNDYGFEHVFSRQIEGLGRKGDLIIGLSMSGNSKNIIRAFEVAKQKGMKTVGLIGRGGGAMKELSDLAIIVPGESSDRIQELHIKIIHMIFRQSLDLAPGNTSRFYQHIARLLNLFIGH